ncbi:MAG: DUF5691 domain-containing protein [Chloroflexota bacterium]
MILHTLRKTALLGTNNVITQSPCPEVDLLGDAAQALITQRAGYIPTTWEGDLPQPAAPNTQPHGPATVDDVMTLLLTQNDNRYWFMWLECLKERGYSLPPHWIDTVMRRLHDHVLVRDDLIVLADERGHWLQQFEPTWHTIYIDPADDSDPDLWLQNFRRLRTANPTLARQMLMLKWDELDEDDRLETLDALFINLSDDDIPFIEAQLTGEQLWVRQTAYELNMSLPESNLARQAVRWTSFYLLTTEKEDAGHVVVPGVSDAGPSAPLPMHADSYEGMDDDDLYQLTENFQYVLEEIISDIPEDEPIYWRLFHIYQILELAPPVVWAQHYNVDIPQLLHMVMHSDWRDFFLQAWQSNRHTPQDIQFAEALVKACFANGLFEVETGTLAQKLPFVTREALFRRYWNTQVNPESYAAITLIHMMETGTWPDNFGLFLLDELDTMLQQETIPWGTADRLMKAIQNHINTRLMPQIRDLVWQQHDLWMRYMCYWRVDALLNTLRIRMAMEEAL